MSTEKKIIDASYLIHYVEETGSTNEDALALARQGAEEGTCIVADFQSQGRGRAEKSWEAEKGAALLASVLVYPRFELQRWHMAGLALALAGAQACEASGGVPVLVKWPNDLVIETGSELLKLAGILSQAEARALVLGIGVNLQTPDLKIDSGQKMYALKPIGLNEVSGKEILRDDLLEEILRSFKGRYEVLGTEAGCSQIINELSERSALLGKQVRVQTPNGELEGLAEGFSPLGCLKLKTKTQTLELSVSENISIRS